SRTALGTAGTIGVTRPRCSWVGSSGRYGAPEPGRRDRERLLLGAGQRRGGAAGFHLLAARRLHFLQELRGQVPYGLAVERQLLQAQLLHGRIPLWFGGMVDQQRGRAAPFGETPSC